MSDVPPVITGTLRATRCVICGHPLHDGPRDLAGGVGIMVTSRGAMHLPCAAEEVGRATPTPIDRPLFDTPSPGL